MKKNKQLLNNQSGFTLMEVLIAITILSFIMVAVVTITDSSLNMKERILMEDRESLQVETAFSRIEWDFSQIYSPLYFSHAMEPTNLTEEEGEVYNQLIDTYQSNDRFSFPSYDGLPVPRMKTPSKTSLVFLATSNRRKLKNIKQSHFAWIKYDLITPKDSSDEDDEQLKGDVLVRYFVPNNVYSPDSIPWDKVKAQVLLRGIESLEYEFWNPETKKWTDNMDLIKDGNHLIRGLKIKMEWNAPDGSLRTYIRVFRPLFPQFTPENMYKLETTEEEDIQETE